MSAITLLVNHVGPSNERQAELIKAATNLLKDIIGKDPETELIVVEEKSGLDLRESYPNP